MSARYVKLIARSGGWFKPGTEVYSYDCNPPDDLCRMPMAEWEKWAEHRSVGGEVFQLLGRGIHIVDSEEEARVFGLKVGDERWDGELCCGGEFDVTFVEEAR